MHPRDLVVRFLDSIGRPREAEAYLSLFQSEQQSFALIAVDSDVLRDEAGALVVDLQFLSRLGLSPIVAVRADASAIQSQAPDVSVRTFDEFTELASLAAELGSKKLIFLRPRSGLQPIGEPVTSLVNITTEYAALSATLPPEQAELLQRIQQIMTTVSHSMTVSVTSPLDLLRELFTVRGAGTLIRRGASVRYYESYDQAEPERLRALMQTAFGSALDADYFDRPVHRIYIADDYRGVAITYDTDLGAHYLSKFAVEQLARGEGIGRDLWSAMTGDHDKLFWRSRPNNPITPWYTQNCDGLVRGDDWHIFWRGLHADELAPVIDYAKRQPVDFS